jgi:hypothetical protein
MQKIEEVEITLPVLLIIDLKFYRNCFKSILRPIKDELDAFESNLHF